MLAGTQPEKMLAAAERMMGRNSTWTNPFGNGEAARRILAVCKNKGTL
jgi:UDP-N-acetylglucosamine 2-epimerase